jgi:hypothetical protein
MSRNPITYLFLSVTTTLSFVALLTVILIGVPLQSALTEGDFAGGSGTESDPYLVATAIQLDNVRNHLDAHSRQTADINLDVATVTAWE